MKSDERILQLPQPIIDRLREVIGRIRRQQWIKGSLFTLAAAVAAVLGVMAADAAFSLESLPLRMGLSLAGLAFVLWIAWTQWLRPLSRRISLTAVARWVENRHPELQERISTAVELLDARHGADDQGSRELLEAVVQDAVADVRRVDPAAELSARRTLPAKWLAGSTVAVLALLAACWPDQVPRLLARALAPMADVGNAWAGRLRVLTGDQTIAIGDPLKIEVAVSGNRERVVLHLTAPDGRTTVEMLSPDAAVPLQEGETGYALRLPAVTEGFTAKVVAGKAVSAAFTIKAVPRPDTGELTLTYDYPDYTGMTDETKTGVSGEIVAVAGTRVTVQAPLNRPAAKASVKIGELDVPGVKLSTDPAAPAVEWSTVLTPNLDALWSLHLEDADAITNRPVELPIRSIADLPPVITLETPVEDRLELRPVEKVALVYSVREDIGLSAIQIRISPQDQPEYYLPPSAMPDAVPDNPGSYRGTAVLDLAKVLVPDGKEIRVCLMAADRVPAAQQGPQRGFSREIVIRLNKWTRPQVEKNFEAQHDELRRKMEEVKNQLQHARGRMNDKPDRLRREDQLSDNTLKDLESSTGHMQEAQTLLQELTERIKETAYARQAPELENIAREMVQPAQAQAKDIPVTDEKEARAALAQQSKDLLENAIRTLEEEQRQMNQDRQAVQQIAKLSEIAEQQQRLAQEAATASAPQNAEPTSPDEANPGTASPQAAPANQPAPPEAANPAAAAAAAEAAETAAPKPPTDEQQRKWLEEQRRIAERAKQLMQENQNANPQAQQEQLQQAAAQAAQLAAEAEALSKKEGALASELASADRAGNRPQQAANQQEMAGQIAALQEKARSFQESSAKAIDQSTETQEAAHQARSSLDDAAGQARQSGEELAKTPTQDPAAGDAANSGSPANENQTAGQKSPAPETAAGGTPESAPPPETPQAAPGENSAANSPPSTAQPAADGSAATAQDDATGQDAAGTNTLARPPAAGQQAAMDSAQSLADAAESLKSLGAELNSLAGMVADHNKSLGEGAQQAGTAAEQAAQSKDQQQGKGPSMQQGAQAAQAAADQLAMAANTAMQAMSIPAQAKTSQASANSKGKGKPQNGQPTPSQQPGQEGKDGLQMDTASSALPAELAKLGLTQDDWMKLRSSLNGVDGVSSEQIPAEYRDLVKAYFGALATGGNAPLTKQ